MVTLTLTRERAQAYLVSLMAMADAYEAESKWQLAAIYHTMAAELAITLNGEG